MTIDAAAMKVALDLLHVPSRVRPIRSAVLPDGVPTLLEIAAGDAEATSSAAELTGRSPAVLRDAATFFVEQILLAPDADSYRVLGADPQASNADLRRNMALLLKWLHPDMEHNSNGQADRSMFAGRVTLAWDDLKTAERRAAYDAAHQRQDARKPVRRGNARARSGKAAGVRNAPRGGVHMAGRPGQAPRGIWQALLSLFGRPRH